MGSKPQADGSVLQPDGKTVSAADVTLPDGVQLSAAMYFTREVPAPAAKMPDGSKPSQSVGSSWLQQVQSSTASMPRPSVRWVVGISLPAGSKMSDGSPVPEGSLTQADGSVLLPDGATISAENVTLPNGSKFSGIRGSSAEISAQAAAQAPSQSDTATASKFAESSVDASASQSSSTVQAQSSVSSTSQGSTKDASAAGAISSHVLCTPSSCVLVAGCM